MRPIAVSGIIWIVIALLGVISWLVPDDGWTLGDYTLSWPTLSDIILGDEHTDALLSDSSWIALVDSIDTIPVDTIRCDSIPTDTLPATPRTVVPTVNVADIDTRAHLMAFYQALDSSHTMPIRVVHYGDSQIEEDRITNILREQWQKQYGGGGVGLIPLHQTIPTRTIRQWLSIGGVVQTAQKGPKRYLIYGPKSMRLTDSDDYGVMGQVAVMDTALVPGSDSVVLHVEPLDKKRKPHNYFNRIRLLTDSISGYVMAHDSLYPLTSSPLSIADSTTRCEIHLQGKGKVYGVSLETPMGVIVDNIPMRGCSGNIFTKIDSTQLSDFYRETNTRLIIMQFGGNMIPQTENPATIRGYVRSTMRQQVRYLRACAPEASILFISPSDMSTNMDGEMVTYPLVPYMDRLLKKMAQEEGIAYWSMYEAMGGKGSMVRWVENGLAGSDYVHFTRAGANNIGKKLYNWLMSYQSDSLNTKL